MFSLEARKAKIPPKNHISDQEEEANSDKFVDEPHVAIPFPKQMTDQNVAAEVSGKFSWVLFVESWNYSDGENHSDDGLEKFRDKVKLFLEIRFFDVFLRSSIFEDDDDNFGEIELDVAAFQKQKKEQVLISRMLKSLHSLLKLNFKRVHSHCGWSWLTPTGAQPNEPDPTSFSISKPNFSTTEANVGNLVIFPGSTAKKV